MDTLSAKQLMQKLGQNLLEEDLKVSWWTQNVTSILSILEQYALTFPMKTSKHPLKRQKTFVQMPRLFT